MPPSLRNGERRQPQAGDLVGVHEARGPQLALIQEIRAHKAVVRFASEARQPAAVPLRDLDRIAPHEAPGVSEVLAELSPQRLQGHLPSRRELAMAWLLLRDQPAGAQGPELDALADLLGKGESVPLRAALWQWLQGDQCWFRWRQQRAEPRGLGEIQALRQSRRRQKLQDQRQATWQRLLCARQPLPAEGLDALVLRDLALLQRWAACDCDSPLPAPLLSALQRAHCSPEPGAIRHLLVDLGQWERHQLPSMQCSPWQHGFSAELLLQAEDLVSSADQPRPGDEQRIDLCGQHCFSIDDEDTLDIDDALAIEELGDGERAIWVHIADPGRLVPEGSPLDLEARRRGSSLYLAQGALPMFPPGLAHGPFSLRMGQRCAAWSLRLLLDEEGGLKDCQVQRSWIRPSYRLSYGDADELIDLAPPEEPAPALLHGLLERRRRWRERRGALFLEQPEGRIRCRGERAELQVVEPSAARALVAEAMILSGAAIAELGCRHHLPLPYRSQLPAALPSASELAALDPGPVRHAAIKRCLSRGHVGVTPAAHFSLGLAAYVQATSPIRRYGDLVVQRQLAAHLEGGTALGAPALAALLEAIENPVREGIRLSREDQRHWQQVWFEQNPRPSWAARFLRWLRPQDQLGLVTLEELCIDVPAHCPGGSEPGLALRLKVLEVDSLRDILRLQAGA